MRLAILIVIALENVKSFSSDYLFSSNFDKVVAVSLWDKNIGRDEFMGYSFVAFDDCYKEKDTEKVRNISIFSR